MNKYGTMSNLKKIVKDRNMSLTALSVRLEISQEAISQYISGKIKPKLSTIIKMAQILDTSTDYLLDLTNDPKPSDIELSSDEYRLISSFNKLNDFQKKMVEGYIDALIQANNI